MPPQHQLTYDQTLSFAVEWYDDARQAIRPLTLFYYPNNSVEIKDPNTKRCFLSRIFAPEVTPQSLYIGGSVKMHQLPLVPLPDLLPPHPTSHAHGNSQSRLLHIVDAGDAGTQKYLERLKQRVCLAVLPDAVQSFGRILSAIEQMDGAIISKVEALGLTSDTAAAAPECLARVLPDRGSILAVEVLTDSRQGGWQGWAGVVKDLKADYGEGIYAPGSVEELSEVGPFLFQPHQSFTGGSDESEPCSLCMVKPHVMRERQLGNLVSGILDEGFRIGAMKLLHLSTATAEELLGVYKEVVDGYTSMLEECTVAPVLALQVLPGVSTADPERLIDDFRAYCGPSDPQVAKAIRPDTIRAKFGQGLHKNAVHCTDLHEDGALECKYIFCIVPRALMA